MAEGPGEQDPLISQQSAKGKGATGAYERLHVRSALLLGSFTVLFLQMLQVLEGKAALQMTWWPGSSPPSRIMTLPSSFTTGGSGDPTAR